MVGKGRVNKGFCSQDLWVVEGSGRSVSNLPLSSFGTRRGRRSNFVETSEDDCFL